MRKLPVPDFGFDLRTSLMKNRITSLAKNSNAALAGLHENDEIFAGSFDITSVDRPAIVGVNKSGQGKYIEFISERHEKEILQYRHISRFSTKS